MDKTESETVCIETIFQATMKNIWRAWTDPAVVRQWFGSDAAGEVLYAQLDVRPGGFFEISFRDADHTEHTCSGRYMEVREFSKLSFTWTWKSEPGTESFVTLLLTAAGDGTKMHFEHANMGSASAHDYFNGWKATFAKLEKALITDKNL